MRARTHTHHIDVGFKFQWWNKWNLSTCDILRPFSQSKQLVVKLITVICLWEHLMDFWRHLISENLQ